MNKSLVNPAHILDSYRKSDAVIIVCQNNSQKSFEIAALNEEASRVTGFANAQLVNKPLSTILPERINSTITEFVEFGDDSHDLLSVLLKIRNFSVKSTDGKEMGFRLRVIRGEAIDRNPWFHLVLVDEGKQHQNNVFREVLRDNFKGHETLNDQTMLPNRLSTLKNIELVVHSVQKNEVKASFAVIDINSYDGIRAEFGQDVCNQMHKHIGQVSKQKLRPEDAIGSLNERLVGLVLVDASQEEARMVLNRLRWLIGVSPLEVKDQEVLTQVNIGFAEIDGRISAAEVLEKCESFTLGLRKNKQFNTIQLAVTHERRGEREDRRKMSVPVEVDRRRKERRN